MTKTVSDSLIVTNGARKNTIKPSYTTTWKGKRVTHTGESVPNPDPNSPTKNVFFGFIDENGQPITPVSPNTAKMKNCTYRFRFLNQGADDKRYVGSTIQKVGTRVKGHEREDKDQPVQGKRRRIVSSARLKRARESKGRKALSFNFGVYPPTKHTADLTKGTFTLQEVETKVREEEYTRIKEFKTFTRDKLGYNITDPRKEPLRGGPRKIKAKIANKENKSKTANRKPRKRHKQDLSYLKREFKTPAKRSTRRSGLRGSTTKTSKSNMSIIR